MQIILSKDGNELNYSYLSARYDFSLLVFLRHWHSPWTPKSHLSFSVPYRSAVSTLASCAHRYAVPSDIVALVNSFLPRSWWPDERRSCWCQDCQLDQLKREFGSEKKKKSKPDSFITCSGCQVALACSKEHMKFLHKDGHKRYCGLPPFRAPFAEEDNILCQEILGDAIGIDSILDTNLNDNDDDGSWESVESDDEDAADLGKSDVILSFFNNKSYKFQQRVHLPFWG